MPETRIPWINHLSPQPWFELYASAVLELEPERLIERVVDPIVFASLSLDVGGLTERILRVTPVDALGGLFGKEKKQ